MPKFAALYAVLGIALTPIAGGIPEVNASVLVTPAIQSGSTASKPIFCSLFLRSPLCADK